MKLIQSIPVWRATHVTRHGAGGRSAASDWAEEVAPDEDEPANDEDHDDDGWEDET